MDNQTASVPRPFFYGWVIVAVTGFMAMTFYGMWTLFAVFLKPLSAEFGWTRGDTALAYSLVGILSGIGGLLSGKLSDRFGSKRVVLFGSLCLGLGMILTSFIHSLWQLYLSFSLVLGGFGIGFINVPITSNVPRWFTRNKGLAIGLAMSGTTLGLMVFPPLTRFLIDSLGWRYAAAALGVIGWSVMIPAALLLRSHPRPDEIEPGEDRHATSSKDGDHESQAPKVLPASQAKPVGFIRACMLTCCICHSIPLVHLVAYATDVGIGAMRAATIMSVLGLAGMAGRIGWGMVADKIGGMRTFIICSFLQSFTMLWLIYAREPWMFYAYAVSFGIGYGGIMPTYTVILKEIYGPSDLGSLFGRVSLGGTGGMAVGGYLGGLIFDISGSYTPAFIFSFLVGTITFLLSWYLIWWTHREFRVTGRPFIEAPVGPAAAPASP